MPHSDTFPKASCICDVIALDFMSMIWSLTSFSEQGNRKKLHFSELFLFSGLNYKKEKIFHSKSEGTRTKEACLLKKIKKIKRLQPQCTKDKESMRKH